MQTKSFIAILLCAVILVTSVYSAYQIGSSNGYKSGYGVGFEKGQNSLSSSSAYLMQEKYDIGYQTGYRAGAAQNSTVP